MSLRSEVARLFDPATYSTLPRLRETIEQQGNQIGLLEESFATLQQIAHEDRDWINIGQSHDDFFDAGFIRELILNARVSAVRNPIIARGVSLHGYYVYGRGVTIQVDSGDEGSAALDDALQQFIAANPLLSVAGLTEIDYRMRTDGNIFWVLFTDDLSGSVKVRTIDVLEIAEIVCNPEDAAEPWFYLRSWTEHRFDQASGNTVQTSRQAWHPALGYEPAERPAIMRGIPVRWNAPVLHDCAARQSSKQPLAIPPIYAALDPAKSYRRFLGAWSALQDLYRSIAFEIETPGGQKAVDDKKARLETTMTSTARDTNPPLQTGSVFIHGKGQKISALKTAGATTGPDEARALFLFAIMPMGWPEHMYGDPSTGNLATAKTLDRPTELMVMLAQERAKQSIKRICGWAMSKANAAPMNAEIRTEQEFKIEVKFPPPVEHDIPALLDSITDFVTLKGHPPAGVIDIRSLALLFLHLIGADDPVRIVDAMYPPDSYEPQDWAAMTPEERQQQAEDMAARAQAQGINAREAAQMLASSQLADVGRKLLDSLPRANGHA